MIEFPDDRFLTLFLTFFSLATTTSPENSDKILVIPWQRIEDSSTKQDLLWFLDEAIDKKFVKPIDSKQQLKVKIPSGTRTFQHHVRVRLTSEGLFFLEKAKAQQNIVSKEKQFRTALQQYKHWNTGHKMEPGSMKAAEIKAALDVAERDYQLAKDQYERKYSPKSQIENTSSVTVPPPKKTFWEKVPTWVQLLAAFVTIVLGAIALWEMFTKF